MVGMCELLAESIFAVFSPMVCARFAPDAGCCRVFVLLLALIRRRCGEKRGPLRRKQILGGRGRS